MKHLILALTAILSASAFATTTSYQRFYFPYSQLQEGELACMGSHLIRDTIGNIESSVRSALQGVKSRVNVEYYGVDLAPRNINLLVYGPSAELFNVEAVNQNDKNSWIEVEIILDFAAAKKLEPIDQERSVSLAYYAIQKSLAMWGNNSSYYLSLRLINSPISSIGALNVTEPNGINSYNVDILKLALQTKGILALDSMCQ